MFDKRPPLPLFLVLLDGFVREWKAPAGFEGTVCLGVRSGDEVYWWTAWCSEEEKTHIEMTPKFDAHVLALFGRRAADNVLAGRRPGEDLRVTGDRKLLERFLSRYLSSRYGLGADTWAA